MNGNLITWLYGSVELILSGNSCERFFNLCVFHGIILWNVRPVKEGYQFFLSVRNFWKIKPFVKKCHVKILVKKRCGLPFFLRHCRKRLPFVTAACFAVIFIFSLSFFIWDIHIAGNHVLTDEKIMDYLIDTGIRQGIPKAAIDYKKLASDLRENFDTITWVSVRLEGTRLQIDLQENTDLKLTDQVSYPPSDLVSDVDGVVENVLTRAGTPLVQAGDEVKKGDILISGEVELINDSQEVYGYQFVPADADVSIRSVITYTEKLPLKTEEKEYTGKHNRKFIFQIGRLSLGIPLGWKRFEQAEQVIAQQQFRMMDNFYLPLYFTEQEEKEYTIIEKTRTVSEVSALLKNNFNHFLKNLEEKGVQIFQNDVKIEKNGVLCTAKGTITVIAKAGVREERSENEYGRENNNSSGRT